MSSSLLTKDRARKAIDMFRVNLEGLMDMGTFKRRALHIVIPDPTKRYGVYSWEEEVILYEESLGEPVEKWERDFRSFAREKAHVCWMTGLDSHVVHQQCPHLYTTQQIKYGGGVVRHGLIVAASGVEWYYDQMVAEWVTSACRALCIGAMEVIMEDDDAYLP